MLCIWTPNWASKEKQILFSNYWSSQIGLNANDITGLEEVSNRYGLTNEHVALVTFGHETKVQQRLTNDYKKIRQLVGKKLYLLLQKSHGSDKLT